MKKILLDIHIYLSLLCAGYMIIYGVSGIAFNHHLRPPATEGATWEASIRVPALDKDQAIAEAARDRLDLSGWVPSWRLSHPQPDELLFFVTGVTGFRGDCPERRRIIDRGSVMIGAIGLGGDGRQGEAENSSE